MTEFAEGDRVRVLDSEGFVQPWRNRFKSGRIGTVLKRPLHMTDEWIEWDNHTKGKKPVYGWRLNHRAKDLVLATSEGK